MRVVPGMAAVVGVVTAMAGIGFGQAGRPATPSLEGVWENTSVTATGPNGTSIPKRPPNINIWTKKYFSRVVDGPARSVLAAPKDPAKLTDAEKLARYEHWTVVTGVAGVYEQKGTRWFQYPSVGRDQTPDYIARQKNPTAAATPVIGQDITFEGSTLVLTQPSADGKTTTRRTYRRLDPAPGTTAARHPIEGVWRGTSTASTGATPSSNPNRQPNIFIYSRGYYTIVRQDGGLPVPPRLVLAAPKDAANLTNAEKLARYEHWQNVAMNAGRYEVKGTTLYQYDLVAMNQSAEIVARNKTGNLGTVNPNSELRFEGNNTMIQISKSADGKTESRRTYTRLE